MQPVLLKEIIYRLKRPAHFVKTGLLRGLYGQLIFGSPQKKLKILAITGTDGKTTSTTMLYHVLKSAGKRVALLSTVAAYIDDEEITTGLHVTSPDPFSLYKLMRKMVDRGIEYLVLEYTSHGAYQYRLWGIRPLIAGVTNIDHEHWDYHLNYQNYVEAKALLLNKAPILVLNRDDQSFPRLRRIIPAHKHHFLDYSVSQPLPKKVDIAVNERFIERYNLSNARLVYTIASQLGISDDDFAKAIESFPGVPGRMQFVPTKRNFEVVVDFAHTPQGLEAALHTLQHYMKVKKRTGRLIAVYGAAGLRDNTKRPLMGQIGVNHADVVILTAEDPRTEDVWTIIRQMKEQLKDGHNRVISIADRRQAIEFALTKLAKAGDIVGLFGKGPEQSMCYGKTEYPWSEVGVVKEILKLK